MDSEDNDELQVDKTLEDKLRAFEERMNKKRQEEEAEAARLERLRQHQEALRKAGHKP